MLTEYGLRVEAFWRLSTRNFTVKLAQDEHLGDDIEK